MITKLKQKISRELPGVDAHLEMVPNGRRLTPEDSDIAPKKSAVISLLHHNPNSNALDILFIERTNKGTHGGQIAFPGGKMEPEDQNLWATALRETKEEVGIPSQKITHLGALTEVYIPVSNYIVYPYLGWFDDLQKPQLINEIAEVEDSFWAPVSLILDDNAIQRTDIETNRGRKIKDIPYFEVNNKIVWGATALILNEIRHLFKSL